MPEVVKHGHIDYSDARYGRVLSLGTHENGEPIFTITTPRTDLEPKDPDPSYVAVIAAGLRETFSLTEDEIAAYLSEK